MVEQNQQQVKARMRMMLIGVGIVFGGIFLYKMIMTLFIKFMMAMQTHVVPVSVTKVEYQQWQPKITASGSLRANQGVNVTTELAGMVQQIYFTPGAYVTAGTVLVQLNAGTEIGQLQSAEAQAALADITYQRDLAQFAVKAVSKQTVDTDRENLKNLRGLVAQQTATLAKKTIRAPFSGRLGIDNIDVGEYVSPGDAITSLQDINPMLLDFFVPQQSLLQLKVGLPVTVTCDALPGKQFKGVVTTINPEVDSKTRNVGVEATLENPNGLLTPGTFATIEVNVDKPVRFLTLPQTAITFNPYGDIVYIVRGKGKNLTVNELFVTTGLTRGDQIAIVKGLKEGDLVVTSGQLKLKNGMHVAINNTLAPSDNPMPSLEDGN